eukprot:sb/3479437/
MMAEITRLEQRVREGGKEGQKEALNGFQRMQSELVFGGGPLTFDINPLIAAINRLELETLLSIQFTWRTAIQSCVVENACPDIRERPLISGYQSVTGSYAIALLNTLLPPLHPPLPPPLYTTPPLFYHPLLPISPPLHPPLYTPTPRYHTLLPPGESDDEDEEGERTPPLSREPPPPRDLTIRSQPPARDYQSQPPTPSCSRDYQPANTARDYQRSSEHQPKPMLTPSDFAKPGPGPTTADADDIRLPPLPRSSAKRTPTRPTQSVLQQYPQVPPQQSPVPGFASLDLGRAAEDRVQMEREQERQVAALRREEEERREEEQRREEERRREAERREMERREMERRETARIEAEMREAQRIEIEEQVRRETERMAQADRQNRQQRPLFPPPTSRSDTPPSSAEALAGATGGSWGADDELDTRYNDICKNTSIKRLFTALTNFTDPTKVNYCTIEELFTPYLFFVTSPLNRNDILDKLQVMINKWVDNLEVEKNHAVGSIVLAKFDGDWYRACITTAKPGGKYGVLFIDYGNRAERAGNTSFNNQSEIVIKAH